MLYCNKYTYVFPCGAIISHVYNRSLHLRFYRTWIKSLYRSGRLSCLLYDFKRLGNPPSQIHCGNQMAFSFISLPELTSYISPLTSPSLSILFPLTPIIPITTAPFLIPARSYFVPTFPVGFFFHNAFHLPFILNNIILDKYKI